MPLVTATNGTELAYDTCGNPDSPTLLLIEGLGAQLLGWRGELCYLLAAAGFHVIRFDNRDVGRSQRFPRVRYRLADMADDTAGLLRALELGSAHVVGQSMGGMIAQELAIRHPSLVSSLGLLYTSASAARVIGQDLVAERSDAAPPQNRSAAAERYVGEEAACASPRYPQDTEWLRELGGRMFDRGSDSRGVARQTEAILSSPDRSEALRFLRLPTVVIAGDADRLIDPRASEELHTLLDGSELTVFPGMGHELPRPLWPEIVAAITANARRSAALTGA